MRRRSWQFRETHWLPTAFIIVKKERFNKTETPEGTVMPARPSNFSKSCPLEIFYA